MSNKQKTIFIVITRGALARNILRCGVLGYIKKAGLNVVVLFLRHKLPLPQQLRDEFEDSQVQVEEVKDFYIRGHNLFSKIVDLLVYTDSTRRFAIFNEMRWGRPSFWKYVEGMIFVPLSKIQFLKKLARYLERRIFSKEIYGELFNKHTPSVVLSTSIASKADIQFMAEAERRGIPTVSMPKGWDNVTKTLYRFVPDKLAVHNELMREAAVDIQRVKRENVVTVGFPQFDLYRKPEIIINRENYCKQMGLDPSRKIIFFGSEGRWASSDEKIVLALAEAVGDGGIFAKTASLIIRPHFTDIKERRFDKFEQFKNVIVDKTITTSNFFMDNWDPGMEETKKFVNLLYHCDVLVTVASTLNLDAVCFDKPLININYGVLQHPKTGKDITPVLYMADHLQWVLDTGAVDLVSSDLELKNKIGEYLIDPSKKSKERGLLLDSICYKVDGNSSKRLADIVISYTK